MAVFRVEKNSGYTVMSNHHLRNRALSLKAKGLLSQMLSLPEDWDYTLQGLARINRESIDAIRQAIRELEQAGYIQRSRERDEKGRLRGADYVINLLCDRADDKYGGRLPVHVRLILDEFANIGQIPNFDKLIATIRSREISASMPDIPFLSPFFLSVVIVCHDFHLPASDAAYRKYFSAARFRLAAVPWSAGKSDTST